MRTKERFCEFCNISLGEQSETKYHECHRHCDECSYLCMTCQQELVDEY